jgi:hypothetical protein
VQIGVFLQLTFCVKQAAEKAIPRAKICEFSKPWWNKDLAKLRQEMAK